MDLSRWNNLNQNNSFLLVVVVTESVILQGQLCLISTYTGKTTVN